MTSTLLSQINQTPSHAIKAVLAQHYAAVPDDLLTDLSAIQEELQKRFPRYAQPVIEQWNAYLDTLDDQAAYQVAYQLFQSDAVQLYVALTASGLEQFADEMDLAPVQLNSENLLMCIAADGQYQVRYRDHIVAMLQAMIDLNPHMDNFPGLEDNQMLIDNVALPDVRQNLQRFRDIGDDLMTEYEFNDGLNSENSCSLDVREISPALAISQISWDIYQSVEAPNHMTMGVVNGLDELAPRHVKTLAEFVHQTQTWDEAQCRQHLLHIWREQLCDSNLDDEYQELLRCACEGDLDNVLRSGLDIDEFIDNLREDREFFEQFTNSIDA